MSCSLLNRSPVYLIYIVLIAQLIGLPSLGQVQCDPPATKTQTATTTTTTRTKMMKQHPNNRPAEQDSIRLNRIPQRFARPTDGDQATVNTIRRVNYLPQGPPPYRPVSLMLALNAGLGKLNFPSLKWSLQRRKIYYTFLDVMRSLHRLADQVARGKLRLTGAKLRLLQEMISRLAALGGKSLKMKWPLVMMNPLFLKELLSNPTFLVMLFHAIELAYVSAPATNIWLKPFLKLVKQPSPEKEEESWWRRKRLYESFNGLGSSEWQPNLRTIHFRQPGKPAQASWPLLRRLFPNFYDKSLLEPAKYRHQQPSEPVQLAMSNEVADWQLQVMEPIGEEQLLSQAEFEALEDGEKERIFKEAKEKLDEFRWTNRLIESQSSLVDSLRMTSKLDHFNQQDTDEGQQHQRPQQAPAEIESEFETETDPATGQGSLSAEQHNTYRD